MSENKARRKNVKLYDMEFEQQNCDLFKCYWWYHSADISAALLMDIRNEMGTNYDRFLKEFC